MTGDPPVVGNDDKLLAKFHSGTLIGQAGALGIPWHHVVTGERPEH